MPNKPKDLQGELWHELSVQHHWFHVLRSTIINGDMRDMGVNAWAAYCIIKGHSELKSGESWPSIESIAGYMGVSKATAERAVKVLVEKGYVERLNNRRGRLSGTFAVKESVPMTMEGEVVAKGERTYQPLGFEAFIAELKKFAASGKLPADKNISINFTVNVITQGDNSVVHIGDVTTNNEINVETAVDRERRQAYIAEMRAKLKGFM